MHDKIKRMQCRKALMILCQKKSGMISVVYKMPYDERESDVMRHPALFLKGYVFIENLMKALKYLRITLFYIL